MPVLSFESRLFLSLYIGTRLSFIAFCRLEHVVEHPENLLAAMADDIDLPAGFGRVDVLEMVTEGGHTLVDDVGRRYQLVGHVVEERCLHPVGLLGLTVGCLQLLTALLQLLRQLFLLADVGGQRLLHLLEVALELAYLVFTIGVGNGLVVVAVGDAPGRLREQRQRLQLMVSEQPAGYEEDEQTQRRDDVQQVEQIVVFAEDVAVGVGDANAPSEVFHDASGGFGAHERLVHHVPLFTVFLVGQEA